MCIQDGLNVNVVVPIFETEPTPLTSSILKRFSTSYGQELTRGEFLQKDLNFNKTFAQRLIKKEHEKTLVELGILDEDKIRVLDQTARSLRLPPGNWNFVGAAPTLAFFQPNVYTDRIEVDQSGYFGHEFYSRLPSNDYTVFILRRHFPIGEIPLEVQKNAMEIDRYVRAAVTTMVARCHVGASFRRIPPILSDDHPWADLLKIEDFDPQPLPIGCEAFGEMIGLYRMVYYMAERSIQPPDDNEPHLCKWIRMKGHIIWSRMDKEKVAEMVAAPFPERNIFVDTYDPEFQRAEKEKLDAREALQAQHQAESFGQNPENTSELSHKQSCMTNPDSQSSKKPVSQEKTDSIPKPVAVVSSDDVEVKRGVALPETYRQREQRELIHLFRPQRANNGNSLYFIFNSVFSLLFASIPQIIVVFY